MNVNDEKTAYTPTEARNIQAVLDWIEAFNKNDMDGIDATWTKDALDHSAFPGQPRGAEGMKMAVGIYRSIFSNLIFTHDEIIAHDNIVAVRYHFTCNHAGEFQGIAPSGKEIAATGMNFFRMENGKIAENWLNFDVAGVVAQMREASAG